MAGQQETGIKTFKYYQSLCCPETKQELDLLTLAEAESRMAEKLLPLRIKSQGISSDAPAPIGVTREVLLRKDLLCAYPVVDGIPVLIVPEMLGISSLQRDFDLKDRRYAEPYAEMDIYNKVAIEELKDIKGSEAYKIIEPLLGASRELFDSFPNPPSLWIDAVYDCGGQWDAYNHIAPMHGKRVLQIGGKGIHAIKFILTGAEEAWLLSPMLGELYFANALAVTVGVADKLHCVMGIAEEMPFMDGFFDAVYSGGCVHHMETTLALPEIFRILCEGGKFSAVDPWHTPVYDLGKRIFGQRESAHCHPLTSESIEPLNKVFNDVQVIHHGALLRYPLLVLNKCGVTISINTAWRASRFDDLVAGLLPGFRDLMGGSVALICTKQVGL